MVGGSFAFGEKQIESSNRLNAVLRLSFSALPTLIILSEMRPKSHKMLEKSDLTVDIDFIAGNYNTLYSTHKLQLNSNAQQRVLCL